MNFDFDSRDRLINPLDRDILVCNDCHQSFSDETEYINHRRECVQLDLPVLEPIENTHDDESNVGSPPKLELIEPNSSDEEDLFPSTSKVHTPERLFKKDNGECPFGYKEIFRKHLILKNTKFPVIYSIQRPSEWSDEESKQTSHLYKITNPIEQRNLIESVTTLDSPTLKAYSKMRCPICSLVLYRHNYGVHYRIHSGQMPFQCLFCERRFRSSSSRKVHHRWHSGEKPYVCSHTPCTYRTITKRNLDRHIQNMHLKKSKETVIKRRSVKIRILRPKER